MSEQSIIDLLKSHSIRPTANRIQIIETLAAQSRPVSLLELETELDTLDKSVISRSLSLFKEKHLLHTIEGGADSLRYELCHSRGEEDSDAHLHFYCHSCHKTFCIEEIPCPQVNLPEGYVRESVNFVIKGLCPDCSKSQT